MNAYRHGDLALVKIDKLPDGLKKSKSKIIMTGSGGNYHRFDEGEFYPVNRGQFTIGYLVVAEKMTRLEREVKRLRKINRKEK